MPQPDHLSVLYISLVDASIRAGNNEHVIGIAGGLAHLGHRVTLAAPVSALPDQRLEEAGVTVHPSKPGGSAVATAFALQRIVRELLSRKRFDAIYLRGFAGDWPLLVPAIPSNIPFVYELNTILDNEYVAVGKPLRAPLYRWLTGCSLRHATGWMPVTPEIGEWAQATSGVSRPIRIALNGTTALPATILDRRDITRRLHGLAPDQLVIAMAGFSRPWHGVGLGLDALAALPSQFQLWLIGSESEEIALQTRALAEARGVGERIRIFDRMPHDDVSVLLAACDIGLGAMALEQKGLREAQEMKVAHALAVGLPVVINHPDPRLQDGLPFVRKVAPRDALALAEGIHDLARHLGPELRSTAHHFASTRLSWSSAAGDTAEFLQSLIDRSPRG